MGQNSPLWLLPQLFFLLCVLLSTALISAQFPSGPVVLSNSVLSVTLNGKAPPGHHYPCITSLSVNGQVIVPPIAVGALFQMDTRGPEGNRWNPTQSGTCSGAPSKLDAWRMHFQHVPNGTGNGVLMGVTPRIFDTTSGHCGEGQFAQQHFNWGVELGSDSTPGFPPEAMVLAQSFRRTNASEPEIHGFVSALPVVYYDCEFAKRCWMLPTSTNFSWEPMTSCGDNNVPGHAIMVCNGANHETALCAGIYTKTKVRVGGPPHANSTFRGGCATRMVSLDKTTFVDDQRTRSRTVVFAAGSGPKVAAALEQTAALLKGRWGNF